MEHSVFESLSVRFNNQLLPSPPNAPPPTFRPQTRASVLDACSHAASLFHAYEYHQAIKAYKRLLRQKQDLVSEALLWFNVGVLRDHLGEHALAGEAYEKAVRFDGSFSIGWFCLGNAMSLIGNFRRALRVFKICEKTFQGGSIDYHQQGLPWKLEKTRVIFNTRQTELRKLQKQHKAPLDHAWSLNRLPAGNIFELGIGIILGSEEDARTLADLPEPNAVELPKSQIHAEVGSLPAGHGQPRRRATTRVSDPQKPLPPTPGESSLVAGMPSQFASLSSLQDWERLSFNSRYNPVKPSDSQRQGNVRPLTTDAMEGNRSLPKGARLDSFGIFALGEEPLRKLQAAANEAFTGPAKTLGRNRLFKPRA